MEPPGCRRGRAGPGLAFLASAVVGPYLAERAQGGGVLAGLGGEVAAEAEHVGPLPQLAVRVGVVQVEAGFDQPPGVRRKGGGLVEFGEFPDPSVYRARLSRRPWWRTSPRTRPPPVRSVPARRPRRSAGHRPRKVVMERVCDVSHSQALCVTKDDKRLAGRLWTTLWTGVLSMWNALIKPVDPHVVALWKTTPTCSDRS